MWTTRARNRWLLIALVVGAGLLMWTGGFLLSSQNSRCVDGPGGHWCSGEFSSDAWHGLGLVSLVVGLAVLIAALAIAMLARRRSHSTLRTR